MNVQNLLNSGANVSITLQLEDLRQVVKDAVGSLKTPTKEPPTKEFLTRKEVLEALKIDSSTLWSWERARYVSSFSVGGRKRYRFEDIEAIRTGKKKKGGTK